MNQSKVISAQSSEERTSFDPMYVDELRKAITQEVFHYLGFPATGPISRLNNYIFQAPTGRFAKLAAQFDAIVSRESYRSAAQWLLSRYMHPAKVIGEETIPHNGPLLIAANHPGTFDAFAIAANLPREDLKTIARGMPLLKALPATSKYLIFSTRDIYVKMTAAREASRHLEEGGALLVFPTGTLDPDPACLPGAEKALSAWSPSLDLLLRRVPEAQVQVASLSGFLAPACLHHPLARVRKTVRERQIAAEIFQVLQQLLFERKFANVPRVFFSPPISAADLSGDRSGSYLPAIQSIAQKCLAGISSC